MDLRLVGSVQDECWRDGECGGGGDIWAKSGIAVWWSVVRRACWIEREGGEPGRNGKQERERAGRGAGDEEVSGFWLLRDTVVRFSSVGEMNI